MVSFYQKIFRPKQHSFFDIVFLAKIAQHNHRNFFIDNNTEECDLMAISVKGQVIRTPLNTVSTLGRATQGVRIMRFKEEGDKVASMTLL